MGAPTPTRKASRFAELVLQPGGMSMEEAVRAADANLEAIRGRLLASVEAILERMQALGGAHGHGPDGRALNDLYALSNTAIGVAGAAGLHALAQVCLSLCELIDRLQAAGAWNGPALRVHLDSLRRLGPGASDSGAEQEAIVAALKRVVARL